MTESTTFPSRSDHPSQDPIHSNKKFNLIIPAGMLIIVASIFLVLAANQILPHGINALSRIGIGGSIAAYGGLAIGILITLIGSVKRYRTPPQHLPSIPTTTNAPVQAQNTAPLVEQSKQVPIENQEQEQDWIVCLIKLFNKKHSNPFTKKDYSAFDKQFHDLQNGKKEEVIYNLLTHPEVSCEEAIFYLIEIESQLSTYLTSIHSSEIDERLAKVAHDKLSNKNTGSFYSIYPLLSASQQCACMTLLMTLPKLSSLQMTVLLKTKMVEHHPFQFMKLTMKGLQDYRMFLNKSYSKYDKDLDKFKYFNLFETLVPTLPNCNLVSIFWRIAKGDLSVHPWRFYYEYTFNGSEDEKTYLRSLPYTQIRQLREYNAYWLGLWDVHQQPNERIVAMCLHPQVYGIDDPREFLKYVSAD